MGDYTDFLRGKIETALRNCKAYKAKSDLQTTMLMAADCIETLQAQHKQAALNYQLYLAFDVPEQEAKICAGGCVRSYADPLEHCDGCEFGGGGHG